MNDTEKSPSMRIYWTTMQMDCHELVERLDAVKRMKSPCGVPVSINIDDQLLGFIISNVLEAVREGTKPYYWGTCESQKEEFSVYVGLKQMANALNGFVLGLDPIGVVDFIGGNESPCVVPVGFTNKDDALMFKLSQQ